MLKLRLKRMGRKSLPFYRLVIMENKVKRSGKTVEEVGYYNPITKEYLLYLLHSPSIFFSLGRQMHLHRLWLSPCFTGLKYNTM